MRNTNAYHKGCLTKPPFYYGFSEGNIRHLGFNKLITSNKFSETDYNKGVQSFGRGGVNFVGRNTKNLTIEVREGASDRVDRYLSINQEKGHQINQAKNH